MRKEPTVEELLAAGLTQADIERVSVSNDDRFSLEVLAILAGEFGVPHSLDRALDCRGVVIPIIRLYAFPYAVDLNNRRARLALQTLRYGESDGIIAAASLAAYGVENLADVPRCRCPFGEYSHLMSA